MIVQTPTRNNDFVETTWKFRSDPAVEYPITWSSCRSPFCGCATLDFYIGFEGDDDHHAVFVVDVEKKSIVKNKEIPFDDAFADRVLSDISEEDWETMHRVFLTGKIFCTEECDVTQVDPPEFPVKEIEGESVMIGYKEIFPWAEILTFEVDGIVYAPIDQYCLDPSCDCKEVAVHLPGFRKGEETPETPTAGIYFNCNNGKWKEVDKGAPGHGCAVLVREMLKNHPDAARIFQNRRKRLRILYQRYRKTRASLLAGEPAPKKPIAGRNDPCPCGSGKKFKKCCGR